MIFDTSTVIAYVRMRKEIYDKITAVTYVEYPRIIYYRGFMVL